MNMENDFNKIIGKNTLPARCDREYSSLCRRILSAAGSVSSDQLHSLYRRFGNRNDEKNDNKKPKTKKGKACNSMN